MKRICFTCNKETEGGVKTKRQDKTIYLCSGECFYAYSKKKRKRNERK